MMSIGDIGDSWTSRSTGVYVGVRVQSYKQVIDLFQTEALRINQCVASRMDDGEQESEKHWR